VAAVVSDILERDQRYPPIAVRRGWEGTALVEVRIAEGGLFTRVTLRESTGFKPLDYEAMRKVARMRKLPDTVPGPESGHMVVQVPIRFIIQ
jgi:protein TonB